ncbi:recombinase family protein [Streptomyces sp. JHA26]|uniref:recombinase family protein n=1 Tax=Streptomyces sp. JHA26 TaxID=1917143 RepID=UPI001C0D767F|nr:recombinase family protein [Streptomyces sp. JHA26]
MSMSSAGSARSPQPRVSGAQALTVPRAPRLRGRPPFGYRASRGPGGTGHAVVPDEGAAVVVRRIFDEYLDGRGLQDIAEGLTADGIPSPSARGCRAGDRTPAWSKGTVRSILVNPRYAAGDGRANGLAPIVPADVRDRVTELFEARRTPSGSSRPSERTYVLRGLVRCTWCNRLMQGTRNNGEHYYRCRVPGGFDRAGQAEHPRNVYLREQAAVGALVSWLGRVWTPARVMRLTGHDFSATEVRHAVHHVGVRLHALPEVPGEEHAALFRSLGLHLAYTNTSRTLNVKVAIGSEGPSVSGALRL